MKKLGIVGGIGPESTIEYYRALVAGYRALVMDGSSPQILINSIDLRPMLELLSTNRAAELAAFLAGEVNRLVAAGAEFALLAANTPHVVFDEVQRQVAIPLISIVQATADQAKRLGLKKVGLFGTSFTMQARFYPDTFAREGMALFVPEVEEQSYIHDKYFTELVNGHLDPQSRKHLMEIVDALKQRNQIEALILGGTEFSVVFREPRICGIPVLDTTLIHAQAAISHMLT